MDATVSSVSEKVIDLLFGVAIKNIGYMWNCSENVKTFKKEVENLMALKETLEQRIRVAKDKGEVPGKDLENWMNNANVKISEATTFITEEDKSTKTRCNAPFCVNLGTYHHYGRMAAKETSSLLQLKKDGELFKDNAFIPLPIPGVLDLYPPKDLENIRTQNWCLRKIIQAIKEFQIVGIVGLGGVGKTTLAKEVAKQMKNQFDHIEFVAISQTVDSKKIKEEVKLAAQKVDKGEKVLIIVDDVWEELKLDEVGIPCGSHYMNCNILLTSRREDVCHVMDAKTIKLNPLEQEEAWTLFERVVDEHEWEERRKSVALDIVKECDGLPLFIQAVGKALKNRETTSWVAALHRLQDPKDENDEYKRKGIKQLKLSYDYLEGKLDRSCFLLCSLFPEDYRIRTELLAYYGLALGIFDNPDCNIQNAKDKVQGAVESLKSSFLLLPEGEEDFKMHDLVRDMAILIQSKGDDKFLVESGKGLTEWKPKKHLEKYKKISLMNNRIRKLTDHEFHFPDLDTFLIQNNEVSTVPDEFFRGMEKLKVLDMSSNKISSLPSSLGNLSELTMLDLSENRSLREISVLMKLASLEILMLRYTGITKIPEEIKQLARLRLLDLSNNRSISEISILGELTCLEILKLRGTGIRKIPEEIGQLTKLWLLDLSNNRSISEISILGKLTCLEILKLEGTGITNIPEEIGQLTKLRLLDVSDCNYLSYVTPGVISKLIRLEELYLNLTDDGNCKFLEELRELKLLRILYLRARDLHSIPKDFQSETLIKFQIKDGETILVLGGYKRILKISELNFSFSMPMIKLIQLSDRLQLKGIKDLENILPSLYREQLDELKHIELWGCENVTRLVKTSEYGPVKTKGGKFFSKLEEIFLFQLDRLEVLCDSSHHPYIISFCNLRTICIFSCSSLLELFPESVARGLVNLKEIYITDCESLEVVISLRRSGSEIEGSKTELDIVFPSLTRIHLRKLPKLVSFYSGHSTIRYPSLDHLRVEFCGSLKRWSYGDQNDIPNIKFEHQGIQYNDINHCIEAWPGGWFWWKARRRNSLGSNSKAAHASAF